MVSGGARGRYSAIVVLVAGLLGVFSALASPSAATKVRGSIASGPGVQTEVSLLPVRTMHEVMTAVVLDAPVPLHEPHSTMQVEGGKFVLEVPDTGPWWVRATRADSAPAAWFSVGFETDTLLPALGLEPAESCVLTLEAPAQAWIAGARSFRNPTLPIFRWRGWQPWLRLESGKEARYRFTASHGSVSLTVGAVGHQPVEVECTASSRVLVKLERQPGSVRRGQLRQGNEPFVGAILVREDGWPVGATDEDGRYVAPPGAYAVLGPTGSYHLADLEGGVTELGAPGGLSLEVGLGSGKFADPAVAMTNWSAAGELLAVRLERMSGSSFIVAVADGVAETTVTARGFSPLRLDWSAPPPSARLAPLKRMKGRVLDPEGAGIPEAEIAVHDGWSFGWLGSSDAAGRFVVEIPEQLSRPWLTARASGYQEFRQPLNVGEEEEEELAVPLVPALGVVGRLVSEAGRGVRGKVVLAERRATGFFLGDVAKWEFDSRFLLGVVDTAEDGSFQLDEVPGDGLWIAASAPGFGTVWRRLPEAASGSRALMLDLEDIVLPREITLRGRVLDEDGTPVPAAAVRFGRSHGPHLRVANTINQPIARADVGPAGDFRIGGLAAGDSVDLLVLAAGFVRQAVPRVSVDLALETEEVEIRLAKALDFSGRVSDAVTGEGVEARIHFEQTVRGGGASAASDSEGRFVIGGFPQGAGVITVTADGYSKLVHPLPELPRRALELALRPEPLVEIAGVVLAGGKPVAQATVEIGPAAAVTDSAGRFMLRAPPGPAALTCAVPGAVQPSRRAIDVAPGMEAITVDVTRVTVRGQVEDAEGFPVAAAAVRISARRPLILAEEVQSRPDGGFAIQLEPGRYVLRASKDGSHSAGTELIVLAEEEPAVLLTLPPPRLLRVAVTGLDPSEAAEVVVQIEFGPVARRGSILPRAAGVGASEPVFEARRYPPGEAILVATVPSTGRSRRQHVQIGPDATTEVKIPFSRDEGRIEGVVTLDGQPLAGESVFVIDERRVDAWSVRTDHRGAFVIDGLRTGEEISIAAVGQRRRVRVGEDSRLDLAARSAVLRGRVVLAETDLPAAGVRVSAAPAHSSTEAARRVDQVISTTTAEDGSFLIDGLFAAPYQVMVTESGGTRAEIVGGSTDVDLSAGEVILVLGVRIPR